MFALLNAILKLLATPRIVELLQQILCQPFCTTLFFFHPVLSQTGHRCAQSKYQISDLYLFNPQVFLFLGQCSYRWGVLILHLKPNRPAYDQNTIQSDLTRRQN